MADLDRPTLDEIYTRVKADMETRVTSGTKIPKKSLLGILAIVFSGAVYLLYGFLATILDQLFPDTATTFFLDRIANLYGLPRKAATFAEGTVQFTGTDGTLVSQGTKVQNSEGLIYLTISATTITSGIAVADIQAEEEGAASNTTETELELVAAQTGVDTLVTASVPPEGGQEKETDSALRARILQRLRNPPSSGTVADYVRWAGEVAGVGKVWALAAEDFAGAGTVGVVIATEDLNVVSPTVKANTQTYIDTVRPVGAAASVVDPLPKPVEFDIKITPNITQTQTSVDTKLNEFFLASTAPGGTLLISHIRSAIASALVLDYEITDIRVSGISIGVNSIETEGLDLAVYDFFNPSDL